MRNNTDVARLAVDRLVDIARQDVTKVGMISLNRNKLTKLKPLCVTFLEHRPGLKLIKLDFILKLNIKGND